MLIWPYQLLIWDSSFHLTLFSSCQWWGCQSVTVLIHICSSRTVDGRDGTKGPPLRKPHMEKFHRVRSGDQVGDIEQLLIIFISRKDRLCDKLYGSKTCDVFPKWTWKCLCTIIKEWLSWNFNSQNGFFLPFIVIMKKIFFYWSRNYLTSPTLKINFTNFSNNRSGYTFTFLLLCSQYNTETVSIIYNNFVLN